MNCVWKETAIDSWRDFHSFKGRNILALIGIIIGTSAVIAMLHIGHNARQQAIKQFSKLGTDVIGVNLYQGEVIDLTAEMLENMPHDVEGIDSFALVSSLGSTIKVGREQINEQTLAISEDYFTIAHARLSQGRAVYDLDNYAPYAVLGNSIAQTISDSLGKANEIGDTIKINGQIFTIVGVLDYVPTNPILGNNINDSILIPLKASRRLGQTGITSIAIKYGKAIDDRIIANQIQQWLIDKYPQVNSSVQTARQIIENIDEQIRIYALLLVGIGSISLLVSGVGIMNVMLISVLERRHEIGLRRAIGASRSDIVVLFLSNSLLLCFIGAFMGLIIGTVVGWIFSMVSGWSYSPSIMAIPLGVFLALFVGLFFGIYPAIRAAKLDIVAALRSD